MKLKGMGHVCMHSLRACWVKLVLSTVTLSTQIFCSDSFNQFSMCEAPPNKAKMCPSIQNVVYFGIRVGGANPGSFLQANRAGTVPCPDGNMWPNYWMLDRECIYDTNFLIMSQLNNYTYSGKKKELKRPSGWMRKSRETHKVTVSFLKRLNKCRFLKEMIIVLQVHAIISKLKELV